MSLNIGVVMDPIAQIKPWKDTTLAMLLEAQRRGVERAQVQRVVGPPNNGDADDGHEEIERRCGYEKKDPACALRMASMRRWRSWRSAALASDERKPEAARGSASGV